MLAVVAYLFQLDGFYIPHIGDEAPYIQITRLTVESGDWLPLQTAPGLENTKPPALFWLGTVATEWGEHWSLLRLRLPIVTVTFLVAALVFWTARKLELDAKTAVIASLTYLGFYSSFQYGRPFLTNAPETLFVFLSIALVLVRAAPSWGSLVAAVVVALAAACGCGRIRRTPEARAPAAAEDDPVNTAAARNPTGP